MRRHARRAAPRGGCGLRRRSCRRCSWCGPWRCSSPASCGPTSTMWSHQWDTRLPGQIASTLILLVGVVTTSVILGVSLAWLVSTYRFPGRRVLSWALVLPLAMPGLHPRLRHHRGVRRRRAAAAVVADHVRRRCVVPRGAFDAVRGAHALVDVVPVRLPAGASCVARSGDRSGGGRPNPRSRAVRGVPPRRARPAPAGDRRRRSDRGDGGADRLRDGAVLRRRHGHRRRVPRVARDVRPRRGQRARLPRPRCSQSASSWPNGCSAAGRGSVSRAVAARVQRLGCSPDHGRGRSRSPSRPC